MHRKIMKSALIAALVSIPAVGSAQTNAAATATPAAATVSPSVAGLQYGDDISRFYTASKNAPIWFRAAKRGRVAAAEKTTPPGGGVVGNEAFSTMPMRRNDLEPGVQVGMLGNHRAFRCAADMHTRRRRIPGVVFKGQGECFASCRTRQRTRVDYSAGSAPA